nr:lipid-A-disaccharide synthase [Roseospira visakhapatnamensis]
MAAPASPEDPDDAPLVFLIAGEPSGDVLGARLMVALRRRLRGRVRFAGIGGEAMTEQGLDTLVPQRELAIMGFLEVVPRIPALRRRLRDTLQAIETLGPAAVVTIDSWGFTGRVAKALTARGSTVPRVHYVAPMVWAWKENRKHAVAARVHHLMTLWPFEAAYFEPLGLACTHVGHGVIESGADAGDGPGFRRRHGIAEDAPVLVVLPGSRRTEVSRLLPVFRAVVARLAGPRPGLRVVVPTVATVAETVAGAVADWPVPVTVVRGATARADAFAAGDAALAASGTVSLELAMAGVPHVIAYKVNPLSALLLRRMTALRFAGPVNILLDREAVPERLQDACVPERLLAILAPLLDGGPAAEAQRAALAEARARLSGGDGPPPSDRAAAVVAGTMTANGPKGR